MKQEEVIEKYYKLILKKMCFEGLFLGVLAGSAHLITLKLLNRK